MRPEPPWWSEGTSLAMRVTSIQARELFSFDTLRLGDLPQTLVVVGPNGAGKPDTGL
jgi:hypothetical protein